MTLYQVIHCAWRVQPWNQNMLAPWKKSYDKPSSVTQFCPILCDPMDYSTPGSLSITNSQSLLKLMSIQSVLPSNHLILCHPLLLLPSIFPASGSFPVSQIFTSGNQSRQINLDSIIKAEMSLWQMKVCIVKAMVFSSSHVWTWELNHKEGWTVNN